MSLKEKLKEIRDALFMSEPMDRDYEFEAELMDHPLGDSNIYRLHYVNYHRFGESYGMGPNNSAIVNFPYKPFMLPEGMSREDAFKVLSYLTDYLEDKLDLDECSLESVEELNKLLDVERLGFTRININIGPEESDVIDLFTVTGRVLLFKNSEYYSKYFEWYTKGVTLKEVKDIYAKCGREFENIKISSKDMLPNKILRRDV